MSKKFAIVVDKDNEMTVIPLKWLTDNKKMMFWPTDQKDITSLIIREADPKDGWDKLEVKKYIRSSGTYTDAVNDLKILGDKIDDVSNPSDDSKLKQSRSARHRKRLPDESDEENAIPSKTLRLDYSSELSDNDSDPDVSQIAENSEKTTPVLQISNLNILQNMNNAKSNSQQSRKEGESTATPKSTTATASGYEDYTERQLLLLTLANQKTILTQLNKLDLNLTEMKSTAKKNKNPSNETTVSLSEKQLKIMAKYFPIDEEEKLLSTVEEKLENQTFYTLVYHSIKTIGGATPKAHLDAIMKRLIDDKVLTGYSYTGQSKREAIKNKCFSDLKLHKVIFYCIKCLYESKGVNEKNIKTYISSYLDSARTRVSRQEKKGGKSNDVGPLHLDLADIVDEDLDEEL